MSLHIELKNKCVSVTANFSVGDNTLTSRSYKRLCLPDFSRLYERHRIFLTNLATGYT